MKTAIEVGKWYRVQDVVVCVERIGVNIIYGSNMRDYDRGYFEQYATPAW